MNKNFKLVGKFLQICVAFWKNLNFTNLISCFWPSTVSCVKGLLKVCFLESDKAFFVKEDLLQLGAASTAAHWTECSKFSLDFLISYLICPLALETFLNRDKLDDTMMLYHIFWTILKEASNLSSFCLRVDSYWSLGVFKKKYLRHFSTMYLKSYSPTATQDKTFLYDFCVSWITS